jgi:hypothetical protein
VLKLLPNQIFKLLEMQAWRNNLCSKLKWLLQLLMQVVKLLLLLNNKNNKLYQWQELEEVALEAL